MYNDVQTQLTEDLIKSLDKELVSDLLMFIDSIQFVRNLINPDRRRIGDMPKDEDGKVIVDIVNPHILEDMDYFRQPAIHFTKYGQYTNIHPNAHPNSSYARFWKEEARRCREGLVRDDGEWIPGPFYFYLNYTPILKTSVQKGKKSGRHVLGLPDLYDGDYCLFHYIEQARANGEHAGMLKKRGAGYSYKAGSGLARLFIVGDSEENKTKVTGFAIADQKEYLIKDGILNKYVSTINWCADHTPWPRMRLKDSFDNMQWTMGYKTPDGLVKGTQNSILGVTTQGDPDKARGKRGSYIFWEEWGKNPHLLKSWEVARESVGEGNISFGVMVGGGTGGTDNADFRGAEELYYNPTGYSIRALPNVFDKNAGENSKCGFFFGAYMNRLNYYDENGNSDVVGALIEILEKRLRVKYGSSDSNTLVQHKAEMCITPQEAILRREGNIFPVVDLKDVLADASVNMTAFTAPHYIGHLKYKSDGNIEWDSKELSAVIREFPIKDQLDRTGNLEIFEMPKKNSEGRVPHNRYIAGIDPIDSDMSTYTNSLGSIFVFDMWTDRIVAEYTGRPPRAADFYDQVLRLLKYYNAQGNYENNIKGLFSFMERNNALHYLCDTPQILRDLELMTGGTYGNTSKGTHANRAINAWARKLQADWMISQAYSAFEEEEPEVDDQGNPVEKKTVLNLHKIRSIGYIKEAIAWVEDLNCDRVSAMGMAMILREDKIKYIDKSAEEKMNDIFNDKFFNTFGGFGKRSKYKPKVKSRDSLRYSTNQINDLKLDK